MTSAAKSVKKVVLAYSGGLDTSIILKWLQETYGCEVVTFTADLGQGEELEPARKKALMLGIKAENIFVEDLREEFVRDFVFPMFRANAVYEGVYLLGTSIARPLIAKKQIEIARKTGADAVCHGATGKGNDQVRFELGYYALEPGIKIIAPWREWTFKGREELLDFARKNQIPVAKDKEGEAPFSVDANLLHSSSEGKVLEDPAKKAPEIVYQRTISPMAAPDKVTTIKIGFAKGDAVSIDGKKLSPATLLKALNDLGRDNGIGRLDLVENRFVGMKSRGVYETPGGTILLAARRGIESITLDRGAAHLKDEIMPRYAELIYNGFWFSPEREMLQALIDKSQEHVEGEVTLELYKGNAIVVGRESAKSLYAPTLVTFEDDKGAYDQKDAQGFIKLNALRLRTLGSGADEIDPIDGRHGMYVFVFVAAAVTLYFAGEALRQRRPAVIVATIVWLLYAVYEFLIGNGTLCDAQCNIRVDLLLIWPLVAIVTLFAVQSPRKWGIAGKIAGGLLLFLVLSAATSFLYIAFVENPEAGQQDKSGSVQGQPAAPPASGTTEAK